MVQLSCIIRFNNHSLDARTIYDMANWSCRVTFIYFFLMILKCEIRRLSKTKKKFDPTYVNIEEVIPTSYLYYQKNSIPPDCRVGQNKNVGRRDLQFE